MKNTPSPESLEQEIAKLRQENKLLKQSLKRKDVEKCADNFHIFFNTVQDFLFVLDEKGDIIDANETVFDRLGYTREELVGKSVLLTHPEERREEAGQIVFDILQGTSEYCPIPLKTKSGQYIPVETRVKKGYWNGKPAIFGVSKDISKMKLSEEKFSKAFQNSLVMSGISDIETGVYVEVNDTFCNALGYTRAEMIGKSSYELNILPIETRNQILANNDIGKGIRNIETKIRKKSGEDLIVLISAVLVYVQDKQYLYTTALDITENLKMHAVLYANEKKLRSIFDIIGVGIALTDDNNSIIECNDAYQKMLGFTEKEVLGKNLTNIKHKVVRADLSPMPVEEFASIKAINEDRDVRDYQEGLLQPDNKIVWLSVNAAPIRLPGYGAIVSCTDITARIEAVEALREKEERFRAMAENITDVIWTLNLNQNRFTYISPSVFQLRGYTVEEAMAQTLQESLSPESMDVVLNQLYPKLQLFLDNPEKKNHHYNELQQKCKDGSFIWIEVISQFQFSKTGDVEVLGVTRNIEKKKQAELALKESETRLKLSNATKDKFFSIIAHDLRNPFGTILGFTSLIDEDSKNEHFDNISEYNSYIQQSAKTGFELLVNLLDWSKIQSGKFKFNPEEFDLFLQVKNLKTSFNAMMNKKQLKFRVLVLPGFLIKADRLMIETVLRNLISNAVKFTPGGGEISISAKKSDEEVLIYISDSGIGLSQDRINRLFKIEDSFTTVGTEQEAGTGLGLILCHDFLEQHQGNISVESELNKGTTFKITIPSDIDIN